MRLKILRTYRGCGAGDVIESPDGAADVLIKRGIAKRTRAKVGRAADKAKPKRKPKIKP